MRSRRFIAGISKVRPRSPRAPEPVVMPAPNRPVVVFEDLMGFTLKSVTNDTDMATFTHSTFREDPSLCHRSESTKYP